MAQTPTENELQKFVLTFENKVIFPLVAAGFERNKCNIFDILNINRQELRHSDFLAFLMNPSLSCEIGQQFLKNFFALLSNENPKLRIDFFKTFYGSFKRVIVKREYKQIDILADIEIDNGKAIEKYILVIENKVDSGEQLYDDNEIKGQLVKYKGIIDTEYKSHTPIFLFLSPNKRPPSESEWTSIDYNLIYAALCRVNLETADNTIKTLISDYKKMIREQFEMENDKELREAALNIYKADKDIFDFIFNNRPNRVNTTAEIMRNFLDGVSFVRFDKDKSKRQNANIVFTTYELRELCDHIYFQVNVNDMLIWAYIEGGTAAERVTLGIKDGAKIKSLTKSIYLFGDRGKTVDGISIHDKLLLENNLAEIEADLQKILETAFALNGVIAEQSADICRRLHGI